MTLPNNIAIGWPSSSFSGWGIYGLNLTLQLISQGRNPVWISQANRLILDKPTEILLNPVMQRQAHLSDLLAKTGLLEFDFPVLHSLRNDFKPSLEEQVARGSKNIGLIFFENTEFSPQGLERAHKYDLIITGSTWNQDILKARGLTHVVNVFQGIDHTLFKPIRENNLFPDRFTIFSGGKLEYRKAQDVVIAAFKEFQATHNEALLIFAWANQWPLIMLTIANSPLIKGVPEISEDNKINYSSWLESNGLPEGSFIDLGNPANREMPYYLASADVAVFPNRCEAGTNLVAMEAMAVGLPVILSANTGHLDLINDSNCYPLAKQAAVKPFKPYAGVDGWAEPDVEEVLTHLETIYVNKVEATNRGQRAAQSLGNFTWDNQIRELLGFVDDLCR